MMTDTVLTDNYMKLILYCYYLSRLDKCRGVRLQFLASQSSRGELTEITIHTQGVIVNMQSLVNSNALQLVRCHGAIKTGKI